MLKELRLENFKSFADEQKILFAPVTVFVGANGSGKSNALDALRFLQGFSRGLDVIDALTGKLKVHPGIRGGTAEVCWDATKPFLIGSKVKVRDQIRFHSAFDIETGVSNFTATEADLRKDAAKLAHSVAITVNSHPAVDTECFKEICTPDHNRRILEAVRHNSSSSSQATLRLGDRKAIGFDERYFQKSLLRTVSGSGLREPWRCSAWAHQFSDIQFLSPSPEHMRQYVPAGKHELGELGENLSSVLQSICEDTNHQDRITEWISQLVSPSIQEIVFDPNKQGEVLLALVEDGIGPVSAKSLSDGTLRFLALLAAVFSAPEGSILVLEEIENGLHPNRVHLLVELFEQFAEYRNIQIIATTHSPQVLLALSDQGLSNAVLFARNEDHPATLVKRLNEIPYFNDVKEKAGVDELFSTGWLEFAV